MVRHISAVVVYAALVGAHTTANLGGLPLERASLVPDLSGKWQLNTALSEDPPAKLERMPRPQSSGPWRHLGGRSSQRDIEEAHDRFLTAPSMFVIKQDGEHIVLTASDGHLRKLTPNGKKMKVDGREVQTKWDNDRLVSKTAIGKAKVTDTYERSTKIARLVVTTTIEMGGSSASVRRVYDAVAE